MDSLRKLFFLLILVAPFLLTGCGTGHDDNEKYFLISDNIQIPYWQTAGAGFTQAAAQLKVWSKFSGPDTYDPKAQQQAFEQAVQQKATGILVSVADPGVLKDDIDRAVAAGIPVITVDSDAPTSKRLFFIGTDNYQAGLIGGRRLAKELNGKGKVAVFTIPETSNMKERLRGYRDALEASPQVKITRIIDIKGDPRVAFDSATQILGDRKEKTDAFVCLEALSGKEVASVLSNDGVKDRVVMAMDTDPDTLDWIRKGVIAATISQKPFTMTYVGLKMLDDLYHHKLKTLDANFAKDSFSPIPAFVDTGSSLVDKSDVDEFVAAQKSVISTQK